MDWISVKDRFPQAAFGLKGRSLLVLVAVAGDGNRKRVTVSQYLPSDDYWVNLMPWETITHWQDMPDPPAI